MELDLNRVMHDLSDYGVSMSRRPDGSVLLNVAHNGHQLQRVVDQSYTTDEIVRMVKFDLLAEAQSASLNEAVQFSCSTDLPTYSHTPISRTRSANLWQTRKLKDL